MFYDKKCNENGLNSNDPSVEENDLLKQIETEDYEHYIKVEKLLKQIETETEKDTPESAKNESSKLACEHCGTTNNLFMFDCKRCKKRLCVRCRIPELHECVSVVWAFTNKYTKHYLNEYAMPEPDFQQGRKKV